MKSSVLSALLALLLLSSGLVAQAKEWTINARQDQLMKDINAAQKKNELTDKEAKKLRSSLADVARKEVKMRTKNGGNVSEEDKAKLEKVLNEVSVDIKRLALEKRVDVAKEKAKETEKKTEKKPAK